MQPPLGAAIVGERVARGRSPGDAGWEREARAERQRRVGAGGAKPQEAVAARKLPPQSTGAQALRQEVDRD